MRKKLYLKRCDGYDWHPWFGWEKCSRFVVVDSDFIDCFCCKHKGEKDELPKLRSSISRHKISP